VLVVLVDVDVGDTVRESTVEATGFPRPGDDGAGWVNISLDRCWEKKDRIGDLLVCWFAFPRGTPPEPRALKRRANFVEEGLVCCLLACLLCFLVACTLHLHSGGHVWMYLVQYGYRRSIEDSGRPDRDGTRHWEAPVLEPHPQKSTGPVSQSCNVLGGAVTKCWPPRLDYIMVFFLAASVPLSGLGAWF
jgi:hypothetical protein